MYSPLLSNLNKYPKVTKIELTRNDNTIVTSKPCIPSHAPLMAKSLASPIPNPGFLIISITIKLKNENPKNAKE